jgi:hypothetical protein
MRTTFTSKPKNSATPAQTPPITLSFVELNNFFIFQKLLMLNFLFADVKNTKKHSKNVKKRDFIVF